MLSLKRIAALSPRVKAQLPILAEICVLQKRNATSSYEHGLKYGQGGRNSFNGNVVTVFGGTGVLGRYVINRLAKVGTQLVVPFRGSEDDVRHIRLMGDLGQIVFMDYDVRDYDSIVKTMSHSNCAINLVGRNYATRNFSMQDCLVDAAASIATAANECSVRQLIHVSHLLAKNDSPSLYMKLKAQSEKVVLEAFPNATIMRPADAYGAEDNYLNRFAYMRKLWYVPVASGSSTVTKRPVFIPNVAQAIVNATLDESYCGKCYELYGPDEYFLHDIMKFVFTLIREDYNPIDVPLKYYKLAGKIAEQSFFPAKLTEDLVVRENLTEDVSRDAFRFADLDITPVNINDSVGLAVVRRHREYINFEEIMMDDEFITPVNRSVDQ